MCLAETTFIGFLCSQDSSFAHEFAEEFDFWFHSLYIIFWTVLHLFIVIFLTFPDMLRSSFRKALKGTYEEQISEMKTTGKGFDAEDDIYLGLG